MTATPDQIEIETSAPAAGFSEMKTATAKALKSKVKVWLVDDNDSLRKLVGELLNHEEGIECARHFSSPVNLLSTLASHPGPDVILLDVQMGEHNGLDAVRPIKSLAPATRVLMFTSCFNPEWRERALSDGASDYLLKTSEFKKVAARIRCPANDTDSQLYRRRRVLPSASKPVADRSPWLLSRALGKLRTWWN